MQLRSIFFYEPIFNQTQTSKTNYFPKINIFANSFFQNSLIWIPSMVILATEWLGLNLVWVIKYSWLDCRSQLSANNVLIWINTYSAKEETLDIYIRNWALFYLTVDHTIMICFWDNFISVSVYMPMQFHLNLINSA